MIAVAFILFALLIAGWLFAPNGEKETKVAAAAPALELGTAKALSQD
jgi:hypothetical protein